MPNRAALKVLFAFEVVATSILGGLFLILPGLVLGLFGAQGGASAELFVRAFGASLLYVAVASYQQRDVENMPAVRTLMVSNVVEDSILAIVFASAAQVGTVNFLGWIFALVFALVAAVNVALLPKAKE